MFKVHEKTKADMERRLAFLGTLPTSPNEVRAHILADQKKNPTDEQVLSWIQWIADESAALRIAIRLKEGFCETCQRPLEKP